MVMGKTYTNEDQCFQFSSFDVMIVVLFNSEKEITVIQSHVYINLLLHFDFCRKASSCIVKNM